jgi:hypothetical protein
MRHNISMSPCIILSPEKERRPSSETNNNVPLFVVGALVVGALVVVLLEAPCPWFV